MISMAARDQPPQRTNYFLVYWMVIVTAIVVGGLWGLEQFL